MLAQLDDSQVAGSAGGGGGAARGGAPRRRRGRGAAARSGADARAPRAAGQGAGRRQGRARSAQRRSRVAEGAHRLAQQQINVAESQVSQQQTDLADMVVRAPFDGVAISKDAQPGEMISPVSAGGGFTRTGIGTIVDMSSLEIEVDVNESYINRVHAGSAGRGGARCLPGLADSGARDHDRADGGSAEGDGARCASGSSKLRLRASCPTWA